ncbi:CDP-6-deoxy-D-xylo-4-hexulose-3-dehydrase [Terrimicrobium sacchariphilum]|uniref:CDP-6-deoxy-D-xylo-4-hexulose-3-dehydrase n=1 Tax=Terrimicrobium sacchariphilum TaxID=690879 RepID=A0A146G4Q8_TERSA|nr:lipopolysaccharide biosynthesis protein RfbH [Terrimicrobium sacchariphilum]GAT31766.1 CDP-6-deoxy-D-xylo-4-hexulose-3-dehydrase [Terrimicrobium sacchariphilum]
MPTSAEELKATILRLTREYSLLAHKANRPGEDTLRPEFVPGQSGIPYAARVFTEDEVEAAVSSTLDFWLTLGSEGAAFEEELARTLGAKYSLLVNSGSSANLVAFSALTTHKLPPHKRILPGDEVITVAAGFPTTVAPIVQNGAIPVFIDTNPVTGNADCSQLEAAFVPGKTKAVMMAHALGNPFDLGVVLEFCHRHDLWLVEDNCDALGCLYSMPVARARSLGLDHLLKIAEEGSHSLIRYEQYPGSEELVLTAPTGVWGDISTQSFYPPHHLTMGEGGAVNIIRRPALKTYAESFRDWGRDCWCPSGKDNTCNKRFSWQLGELPEGYDHKYIYSHLGYNLKPLDPQAAIGRVQLKRLPAFVEARKNNWQYLRAGLADLEEHIQFALPTHATAWNAAGSSPTHFSWDKSGSRTDCSWFGFKMTVRENAPFSRTDLARHLDEKKIGNRMLFGGNLVRQPAFVRLREQNPQAFRVIGDLAGSDRIMNRTLFIGTYPGLSSAQLDYEIKVISDFVKSRV